VLCEKPLALNAAEIAIMQRAEQASGRTAMEAFCHLHHPQLARLKARLAGGAIGKPVAMQAMFAIPLRNDADFRWRAAHGGGALLDLGCYCLSLMRDLAGEPGRVHALAIPRGEVDETFSAQLDFAGVAGQFTCSFTGAFTQHLELVGTEGRMQLDWPFSTKGRETALSCGEETERFAAIDPYVPMLRHFERLCAGAAEYGLGWSLAQARGMDRLFAAAKGS
jgi:predicted dehydrogenase